MSLALTQDITHSKDGQLRDQKDTSKLTTTLLLWASSELYRRQKFCGILGSYDTINVKIVQNFIEFFYHIKKLNFEKYIPNIYVGYG